MPPNRKNTLQDQLKDKGNPMATEAKQGETSALEANVQCRKAIHAQNRKNLLQEQLKDQGCKTSPSMDIDGRTLVYIYIYIYIQTDRQTKLY